MRLYVAVVMPDHVHMIFMPLEDEKQGTFTFEEIVGAIKGASAHSVNKMLQRTGTVWQDESFDHVVRHGDSLEQKIQYVRENPVRKGLVARPEDYKWLWEDREICTAEGGCATRAWPAIPFRFCPASISRGTQQT